MIEYNNSFNDELFSLVVQFTPKLIYTKIKPRKNGKITKYNYLYNYILKCTNKFLPETIYKNFNIRIFWVLNKWQDFPKCEYDNKPIYFIKNKCFRLKLNNNKTELLYTWPKYCCSKCTQNSSVVRQKIENTNLQKFGVKTPFQNKNCIIKAENTNVLKYGKKHFSQTKIWKNKIEQTNIKNIGVSYHMKLLKFRNKAENTCYKNYGVKHPMQSNKILTSAKSSYKYNNIVFKTSIEIAYYIWLTDNNIKFIYQPENKVIKYFDKNNIQHYYHPDFYLIDTNQLIELKGDNHFKNGKLINISNRKLDYIAEAKHECMLKNNVKIILQSEMLNIINYCKTKFNNTYWYQQFKLI